MISTKRSIAVVFVLGLVVHVISLYCTSSRVNQILFPQDHHSFETPTIVLTPFQPLKKSYHDKDATTIELSNDRVHIHYEKQPTLILHVGPPKTGSTSIQDALRMSKRRLWNEDSYFYFQKAQNEETEQGSKASRDSEFKWNTLERQLKEQKHVDYWNDVSGILDHMLREGKNIIISAEELCFERFPDNEFTWKTVLPTLKKWNVEIIVTYRRYYEWVTSWYYQSISNNLRFQASIDLKPNFRDRYIQFETFLNQMLTEAHQLKNRGRWMDAHPTQYAMRKFGRRFKNIKILNMYNSSRDGNTVESFFCEMISNAKSTCNFFKHVNVKHKNMAVNRDFAILIHASFDRGLLSNEAFRSFFSNFEYKEFIFREELKKRKIQLPYKCISNNVLDEVLQISLSFEEHMFPEWFSLDKVKSDHETGFWKAVAENKFCEIDLDTIFSEKIYQPIFSFLDELNNKELFADTISI